MLARLTAAFLFVPAQQVGAGESVLRRFLPSNIRSIRIGLIRFQLLAVPFLMTPHQLKVFFDRFRVFERFFDNAAQYCRVAFLAVLLCTHFMREYRFIIL